VLFVNDGVDLGRGDVVVLAGAELTVKRREHFAKFKVHWGEEACVNFGWSSRCWKARQRREVRFGRRMFSFMFLRSSDTLVKRKITNMRTAVGPLEAVKKR
jgi:hypothetical protein